MAITEGVADTLPKDGGGRFFEGLFDGDAFQAKRGANVFKMINANAITAATEETIWTPAAGKAIRLLGWSLSSSANAALEFQSSVASGTVIAQTPLLAAAGIHDSPDLGLGIVLAADETLELDVTVTSTISGMVWGTEE